MHVRFETQELRESVFIEKTLLSSPTRLWVPSKFVVTGPTFMSRPWGVSKRLRGGNHGLPSLGTTRVDSAAVGLKLVRVFKIWPNMAGTTRPRNLLATRLSPAYRRSLARAWLAFSEFCAQTGRSDPAAVDQQPKVLEGLLVEFIQSLYDVGGTFLTGKYAVLATQTIFRATRGQMRKAWDAVESWEQEREASLRRPLSREMLYCIVGVARLLAWDLALRIPSVAAEWLLVALLLETAF